MTKVIIQDLINSAIQQLKVFHLCHGTMDSYRNRAFKPVSDFYCQKVELYYQPELMDELKMVYQEQFNLGIISRNTLCWRMRGIKILEEMHQQGCFEWKVFTTQNKTLLPCYYEQILSSFINIAGNIQRIGIYRSIADLCKSYNKKLQYFRPESEYFFPNLKGISYSAKWLTKQFLEIWKNVRNDECNPRVRVYDLRHRFATAIMMQWLKEGADLYAKLPYLSTYMGHARFSDTAYYVHLLPENLVHSTSVDWAAFSELIPEVEL